VRLTAGGNTVLGVSQGANRIRSVVLGVAWDSGETPWDLCALICRPGRKVSGDGDFVYWDQPEDPTKRVLLRSAKVPHTRTSERAQLGLALSELAPEVDRIVVSLSTIEPAVDLRDVRSVYLRVVDVASANDMLTFSVPESDKSETCLILGEVYRYQQNWKFRAVGKGYHSGLFGLARDHGVNVTT
jgi:tellurium resistance protein TerD